MPVTSDPRSSREGSILVPLVVALIAVAGLSAALMMITQTYHRTAFASLDRGFAYQAAESGVAYYLARVSDDPDYFDTNPAPHSPLDIGTGSFELLSATAGAGPNEYDLLVQGLWNGSQYRVRAVIGGEQIPIPPGITMVGTGNTSDTVLDLTGALVGSYDPQYGAFDPLAPDASAVINLDGSLNADLGTSIHGDVTLSGTATNSGTITGTLTEGATVPPPDDIDPLVSALLDSSKTSNDNPTLATVFGPSWTPIASAENYGDLIVTGGTYVVPAGTYRVRRLEVGSTAVITFDTSSGPVKLIYVGSGAGTGTGNDLTVTDSAEVLVSSGGSTNGLLTVLGPDCDFKLGPSATYGQCVDDPDNAGYTQVISLGGNASSDDINIDGTFYGRIYAAAHTVRLAGSFYGSLLARQATFYSGSTFGVDLGSLGTGIDGAGQVALLARWHGGYE